MGGGSGGEGGRGGGEGQSVLMPDAGSKLNSVTPGSPLEYDSCTGLSSHTPEPHSCTDTPLYISEATHHPSNESARRVTDDLAWLTV